MVAQSPERNLLIFLAITFFLTLTFSSLAGAESRPWGLSLTVGVPHPVNLAYEKVYDPDWTAAAGLGSLKLTFQNKYTIGISNIDARVRWHPFQGAFFLGGILGFQTLSGAASEGIVVGPTTVPTTLSLNITSIFLTPHLGWVWGIRNPGFFFGLELGEQLPFGASSKLNVAIDDPSLASQLSAVQATLAYQSLLDKLQTYSNQIGLIKFPYAAIKLGWIF
ncbi:MAG: hypothetical protein AABZ55_07825 [Bdellovibrionota bacterium]